MSTKIKIYNLIVLDKSGSMGTVKDVTISGLNEQLQSIRKSQEDFPDQEQIISFATFNDNVDCSTKWNKPISEVEDFTTEDYSPNGMTALNDAIGISINKLKEEIKDELTSRTATVMVSIFTDGWENKSREFTTAQTKELVEEIKQGGMWTVTFIGCGDDVFNVASGYGIGRGDTHSYTAGAVGKQTAFSAIARSRSVRNADYDAIYSKNLSADEAALEVSCLNNDGHFFDNLDINTQEPVDDDSDDSEDVEKS